MHGADTDAALSSERLNVDAQTRRMVNLGMAGLIGAARRGLEARQGGDYSPVPELQAAPTFIAPASARASALSLIDLLDHKARTRNIRPKTVSDNKAYLKKFIEFVGFDDARRVEKRHVREWRDTLAAQTGPALSPKTIGDRYISAVKSALSHGVAEFDLQFNAAAGITDSREAERKERKEWTDEEATEILKSTFRGSSKALSLPHKRALFWVPWIMAYTGLRAGEITQLQGRNLVTKDGIPHLIITPFDGSTKGGNAWATAVHQHLVDLGLLDFIREIGDGPLFYEPYNNGAELTQEEQRSRVLESYKRVGDWVMDEVGLKAPLGRPNHAWRHRFTTVSRACGMDKETRDFMLGSRSKTDAREGYGDWPPAVLNREINKQPRLDVEDTGWRPWLRLLVQATSS